jgi:hypothetical protein
VAAASFSDFYFDNLSRVMLDLLNGNNMLRLHSSRSKFACNKAIKSGDIDVVLACI